MDVVASADRQAAGESVAACDTVAVGFKDRAASDCVTESMREKDRSEGERTIRVRRRLIRWWLDTIRVKGIIEMG